MIVIQTIWIFLHKILLLLKIVAECRKFKKEIIAYIETIPESKDVTIILISAQKRKLKT